MNRASLGRAIELLELPLTLSVFEARRMAAAVRNGHLATQMGNEAHWRYYLGLFGNVTFDGAEG